MTEAFLPPEQKLFLRTVTVSPRKGVNWGLILGLLLNGVLWYVAIMATIFAINAIAQSRGF